MISKNVGAGLCARPLTISFLKIAIIRIAEFLAFDLQKVIHWIIIELMITVVELPEYIRKSEKLLDAEERNKVLEYIARNEKIPVFLITAFGKNEKSNLSKAERNALAKLTTLLVKSFKRGDK